MLGLMKYFCSIACPGPWLPFVFGWREYLYTDNYVIPISPTSLGWVIVPGIIKESPLSSGNGGPMGTNEHASARQIILLRYGARFLERRWEGGGMSGIIMVVLFELRFFSCCQTKPNLYPPLASGRNHLKSSAKMSVLVSFRSGIRFLSSYGIKQDCWVYLHCYKSFCGFHCIADWWHSMWRKV